MGGGSDGERVDDSKIGRRKIQIEFIEDKTRRHITFSKRKAGIMKKAHELSILTGTDVLLLVASETGHIYTFSTRKLKPVITNHQSRNLIQDCLSQPDFSSDEEGGFAHDSPLGVRERLACRLQIFGVNHRGNRLGGRAGVVTPSLTSATLCRTRWTHPRLLAPVPRENWRGSAS